MNTQRRQVLKGMFLTASSSSIIGLGGVSSVWASSEKIDPSLHVVVTDGQLGRSFLEGISTKAALNQDQVLYSGVDLSFVQQLQSVLHRGATTRVVGLVDDASATLIVDLARDVNARLEWQSHHKDLTLADGSRLGSLLVGSPAQVVDQSAEKVSGQYVSFLLEI